MKEKIRSGGGHLPSGRIIIAEGFLGNVGETSYFCTIQKRQ
jgi:hypothetical protein